ncbi:MAG: glyoxalase/bleomycin resistance/extradiol dioxygenase family protein [Streptococcaceae bacterium]|nr:glyoxalase/bleomycin resistance/extradiol dioxygenase family protein [Streptococcaceae bacterium]MCL2681161.1 glyoxalase/bleomycin resistance/extradiol dioxygenase family protein [Streptococcaceae bacterium]MCL2858681.1 glyoxalase/bleomycin resistance/extradiol dioxygenase family protein [Streptococcaceae bacterium]
MISVHPYITLNNTKEALDYYKEVLGATDVTRMPVGPEQAEQFGVPADKAEEMTMHSQFNILGSTIMAADNFQKVEISYTGMSILLNVDAKDEKAMADAQAFWDHLDASGKVTVNMPYEKQFWGGAMGDFTDAYGIRWMLHAQ